MLTTIQSEIPESQDCCGYESSLQGGPEFSYNALVCN